MNVRSGRARAFAVGWPCVRAGAVFGIFFAVFVIAGDLLGAAEQVAVHHAPLQPRSGEAVHIKANLGRATSAMLQYQVVEPGAYIALKDAGYKSKWTDLAMSRPDGTGDFLATVPAEVQKHRRLIRYRIKAEQSGGKRFTLPATNDSQPNFAWFVYDGVPSWHGAIEPASSDPARSRRVEFNGKDLDRLPVYHLISKKSSAEDATWNEHYSGHDYKWQGTLVYNGKVYDHIGFRARGGTWRYAMGKNMWKFAFNKGHEFQAEDNYGQPYDVRWSKLNLGACIQQGQYGHRGEQGMFEAVGFKLFNLARVEASKTHWVHLRVIAGTEEARANNQYAGDFWGLYLAVEEMGGRFLREHHLPNGNLFKMENGTGELKNSGSSGITNKQDLNEFLASYNRGNASDEWWRKHLDLPRYYNYRSIIEGIHHYDVGQGKNYFYFLDPESGRWSVHPWDLDLTWANTMYGDGDEPFKSRVLSRPAFRLEYQNRLREIRDLLFNTNQTWALIDEFAQTLTAGGPEASSIVAADRARWDYDPVMANAGGNAGQGGFYRASPTKDFAGMVQLMKTFVRKRSTYIDTLLLKDSLIPETPRLRWSGPDDFSRLVFEVSDYAGANPFAKMQWRIAEVSPKVDRLTTPRVPGRYEITPMWQSAELATFERRYTIPSGSLKSGSSYRVRARVQDETGRWSHWSVPFEFIQPPPR